MVELRLGVGVGEHLFNCTGGLDQRGVKSCPSMHNLSFPFPCFLKNCFLLLLGKIIP